MLYQKDMEGIVNGYPLISDRICSQLVFCAARKIDLGEERSKQADGSFSHDGGCCFP